MGSKIVIVIIDVISAIPILAYPVALAAGVMMFDAPGSGKSLTAWAVCLLSLGYPLYIIACIALSWSQKSAYWALAGLLPLLVLIYVLFISGGTQYKNDFTVLPKDFICDKNNFLNIEEVGRKGNSIYLLRKESPFSYRKDLVAYIEEGKTLEIRYYHRIWKKDYEKALAFFKGCKNKDGRSVLELYTPKNGMK